MNEQFFTPSRFNILKEVARTPQSASEIAQNTNISLPYILSQLTLLEAKGFIKKLKQKDKHKAGKPKQYYELSNPLIKITLLRKGYGTKFGFEKENKTFERYIHILSFIKDENINRFSRYYWNNCNYFNKILAFGKIKTSNDKIELVAIAKEEDLNILRKQISNYKLKEDEQIINIACWVHSPKEIKNGLLRKDEYYLNLLNRVERIIDPDNILLVEAKNE